jgi:hypothetical protein
VDDILQQEDEVGFDIHKLSVEETLFPSVVLCVNANAIEHRKIGHSATVGMYRNFGFKRIEGLLGEFN